MSSSPSDFDSIAERKSENLDDKCNQISQKSKILNFWNYYSSALQHSDAVVKVNFKFLPFLLTFPLCCGIFLRFATWDESHQLLASMRLRVRKRKRERGVKSSLLVINFWIFRVEELNFNSSRLLCPLWKDFAIAKENKKMWKKKKISSLWENPTRYIAQKKYSGRCLFVVSFFLFFVSRVQRLFSITFYFRAVQSSVCGWSGKSRELKKATIFFIFLFFVLSHMIIGSLFSSSPCFWFVDNFKFLCRAKN